MYDGGMGAITELIDLHETTELVNEGSFENTLATTSRTFHPHTHTVGVHTSMQRSTANQLFPASPRPLSLLKVPPMAPSHPGL